MKRAAALAAAFCTAWMMTAGTGFLQEVSYAAGTGYGASMASAAKETGVGIAPLPDGPSVPAGPDEPVEPEKKTPVIEVKDLSVRMGDTGKLYVSSDSDGTPIFSTSDPDALEVSEDGTVTPRKTGTAAVTVSLPETDSYLGAQISCSVTVTSSLDAPKIESAGISENGLKLTWEREQGIRGYAKAYYLYRKVSGGSYAEIAKISDEEGEDGKLSYTDQTVEEGVRYSYRLEAEMDASDHSAAGSAVKDAWIPATTSLKTSLSDSGVLLDWETPAGASGVRIYRRTQADGAWKKVKTVSSSSMTEWLDRSA
ncbi:MAG: hypothetical protein PUB39_01825 [Eubacteriales bacterium]|nr:hypothetical protein [Eubacteriales bacterium]